MNQTYTHHGYVIVQEQFVSHVLLTTMLSSTPFNYICIKCEICCNTKMVKSPNVKTSKVISDCNKVLTQHVMGY